MKKILIENTIKNVVILILLYAFYEPTLSLYNSIDPQHYDSLLTTATLLIMAVLFADYAFTYTHTNMKHLVDRYLSHGSPENLVEKVHP